MNMMGNKFQVAKGIIEIAIWGIIIYAILSKNLTKIMQMLIIPLAIAFVVLMIIEYRNQKERG